MNRTLFASAQLLVAIALVAGCPSNVECEFYNDCPGTQHCDDGVCVGGTGDGDGDVVGDGDGDGDVVGDGDGDGDADGGVYVPDGGDSPDGGDGDVFTPVVIGLQNPAPWLMRDPRPGANALIVPRYLAGSLDDIRLLNLNTDQLASQPEFDFTFLQAPPCQLDTIAFHPDLTDDEMWLTCDQGTSFRVLYDGDVQSTALEETGAVDFGMRVDVNGNSGVDWDRALYVQRGGAEMISLQLRTTTDVINQPRIRDTFVGLSFGGIVQLWQLPNVNQGNVVLVFDRGTDGARLVPMLRQVGTEQWQPASPQLNLPAVNLPAETTAVVLIDTVNPDGTTANIDANIMTIESSTGRVKFWLYGNNTGQNGQPVYVNEQVFEADANYLAASPAATARLLLEPTPSGSYVVFAHPAVGRVWRLPAGPDAPQATVFERATLEGLNTYPTGAVPAGEDSVWVSMPSLNQLKKYKLQLGG